jgi:hypothetical protein
MLRSSEEQIKNEPVPFSIPKTLIDPQPAIFIINPSKSNAVVLSKVVPL